MVVSVEPIHSSAQKSVDLEIDHLNLIAMQNNFAIKRVESVARRLKLLSNLDLRREEICHEKSHLFTDSYCSFSPNYQSFEKYEYEPSVSLDEKRKALFLFTSGSEDQSHHTSHQQSTHQYTYHHNLPSISSSRSGVSSSKDSLLEKSFSPACRHSRNKILFCLLTTGFSLYALFSIIAPFYPQEANHKGIPTSIYGLVFSSHALTIMLICPLIGRLLHRFEIKNLLICGVFLTGVAMILFGCLHYLESSLLFGLFSFILRIVGAIGFAIFHTSANIYITKLYPKSIGTVFGLIETFCGLGLSFGPVIGGALYDWYGFPMPFWVFGTLTALNVVFYHYLIQPLSEVVPEFEEQLSDDPYSPKLTYWKLLQNIKVLVICLATVVISQNQSFLDPTVEPHLYRHGIKESQVALTFFLMNAAFALLSPIVGWFSLRIDKYILMSLGLLVSATGLLCLGPPFFMDSMPNLKNSSISMIIMGVAYSLTFVPSFEALLEHAVEKDRFENLATYSMVAALYTAIFSLGEATGPALGGIFSQYFGFQMSTLIMSAITLVAGFLMMLTRCI